MSIIKSKYKIGDIVACRTPIDDNLKSSYQKKEIKNFKNVLGIINKIQLKVVKDGSYDGIVYGVDWCDGWKPSDLIDEETIGKLIGEAKRLKRKRKSSE